MSVAIVLYCSKFTEAIHVSNIIKTQTDEENFTIWCRIGIHYYFNVV
jgi:hypothetical protein